MQQKLVISGYGWLAGYLGDALKQHMPIVGTTRSSEKRTALSQQGINAVQFALGDDTAELCTHLSNATFVINIPPGRRNTDLDDFTEKMCALIDDAIASNVAHIVFISTTSVYGDSTDNTLDETAPLSPETASAKAHVAIEQYLSEQVDLASSRTKLTCIRLAGLVGPDRHPAKSLSGRTVSMGNKRVNLVYVTDVVAALTQIITLPSDKRLYHLCSANHPKRGEYYTRAATAFAVPEPVFSDTDSPACGKVIDASASWDSLGITPAFNDPYTMF